VSTYFVQNFGCRAAQADGAALEAQLEERGLQPAHDPDDASVVVLNTCTVTAAADGDARRAIRRIHRQNPEARIVVTGCYAQRAPEELAALPGVTAVVGNSHKHQVAGLVAPPSSNFIPAHALAGDSRVLVSDIFAHTELVAAPVFAGAPGERTRPTLKVQDGCDNRCSFCVIPFVRGQSRSLGLEEIVRQVEQLAAAGYREVVLSGVNLGRWGRDLARPMRFEEMVGTVLERTPVEKLRLSSIEPMDWTDELIALLAGSPRIAKHAHAPLQSGSDRILRAMHRKYRPWHYAGRIQKMRAAMPQAAIGADVMVGFPGESDALFEESRAFIASLPFTYLHVFTYSSRPGVPSSSMPAQVPAQVARERNRVLRALAAEKNLAFRRSLVGKTVPAITLDAAASGFYTETLTDNYLKLRLRGRHPANRWVEARVEMVSRSGLEGAAL
jgi:threonylcarbamoyladenosine tRNA methylthiotransferase MtaB